MTVAPWDQESDQTDARFVCRVPSHAGKEIRPPVRTKHRKLAAAINRGKHS
jgi:hypothetical protein